MIKKIVRKTIFSIFLITIGVFLGVNLNKLGFGVNKLFAIPDSVYDRLQTFSEVIKKISDYYVDRLSYDEIIQKALKGTVGILDPFSAYMTASEFKEMTVETKGEFGGLGIEITKKTERDFITIISPIEDTPAWRAGLKSGDKIIKINGEPTETMTIGEAVSKLRGPKGTTVTITILREGVEEPFDVPIVRDIIKIINVKPKILDNDILYIRVTNFQERTAENVKKVFKENGLYSEKLKGVIVDIRNNPGGLLDEAIKVSDVFLESGTIVSTKGRKTEHFYKANKNDFDFPSGVSLIVLVNKGSASASEILSGAIKDNKKGIILGEKTFGKASVQTILPLRDGSALRLTTARYFTPSGRSIDHEGINPDIFYKKTKLEELSPEKAFEEAMEIRKNPEKDEVVKFAMEIIRGKVKTTQNQSDITPETKEDTE